ncbi:MAG: phospho-N-acetylmuramoyl-pentapeptide-transferase [Verrucomicrobiales bacterium]|jgi:phospho-N-acetylmuramoyl-pentapeptide-transferase|nr:phospho-N-acetylmuramoyl-pentapeptide-transferase [Verrucomicrobiales bacterium]
MLYFLSQLREVFGPLRMFEHVTFRALLAAVCAFAFTLWMGPAVIRALTRLKLGQPIRGRDEVRELADLHDNKKGTPTMGGLLILFSLTMSALLWCRLDNHFVWLALTPTLLLGALGFADDFQKVRHKKSDGISSRQKFVGQVIIALGFGAALMLLPQTETLARSLQVPFLKVAIVSDMGWLSLAFVILVIVSTSNAVNLTDGLDGLAAGCALPVVVFYGALAYLVSHKISADYLLLTRVPQAEELAVYSAALAGSCLGFLWFNCHPAKVFMGDTGSLAIGGSIAVVAICVGQGLLLVIVGGVFVMEALSVILQVASFKLTGKRIFAMSPIHHHFELRGWSETAVVVRFWILCLVFTLVGLATLKIR